MTARAKRLTLIAATLGSFVALLDSTVVSVALPAIRGDLGGGLQSQQWIVNAYLLMLGSLMLIGGSLRGAAAVPPRRGRVRRDVAGMRARA